MERLHRVLGYIIAIENIVYIKDYEKQPNNLILDHIISLHDHEGTLTVKAKL
jgi:hypothetical protein